MLQAGRAAHPDRLQACSACGLALGRPDSLVMIGILAEGLECSPRRVLDGALDATAGVVQLDHLAARLDQPRVLGVVLRKRENEVDHVPELVFAEAGHGQVIGQRFEVLVALEETAERPARLLESGPGAGRVDDVHLGAVPFSERNAQRVLADDAGRDVLQDDRRDAVMPAVAEDVALDDALVAADTHRLGEFAQQPSTSSMGAHCPRRMKDAANTARSLHDGPCHLLELNDLIAAVDGGQVLARVLAEEGLSVGDGSLQGRGRDLVLDCTVEAGGLHDGIVVGIGRQWRSQSMPRHLPHVRHFVDVVRHVDPPSRLRRTSGMRGMG